MKVDEVLATGNPSDCEGVFRDFHDWDKWKQDNVTRTLIVKGVKHEFEATVQRRICKRCGLQEARDL